MNQPQITIGEMENEAYKALGRINNVIAAFGEQIKNMDRKIRELQKENEELKKDKKVEKS